MAQRHGWCPQWIAALNRLVRCEGEAAWHHFSSLYVIPVGPGADLLEVRARLCATSSSVIGEKGQGGKGAESSGSDTGIGLGTMGKNLSKRTCCKSMS